MEKTNHTTIEKEHNGIQQLLLKFIPYWPLFLITIALSVTALYFYLKITIPVFETNASVLIKDEKKGQEDSKMQEILDVFGTKKIVENELEIFHSNSLLSEVTRVMRLYAPFYEEKGWRGMATSSAYLTSPINVEVANPLAIDETPKLYFRLATEDSTVIIDGQKYPLEKWINSPWGNLRFFKNPHYYVNAKKGSVPGKFYFQLITVDHATNGLIGSLTVSAASKQSSIINLSVKDQVSRRAETIISETVIAYNNASAERKSGVAMKTLQFIENRLKTVQHDLDSVESSIQQYRDRTGAIDMSEQSKLYLQSIDANDKQASTMNMQLSALDEVEKYVESKNNGGIVPSTFNINDPTLNQLVNRLSASESKYESLKRTTGESNPQMLSLREEIEKTKPSILETIRSQRKNIEASKSYLNQTTEKYNAMLSTVPKKERQLVEVSRQQSIKNDIYSFLLQKREETAYSITSVLPDCYIVSNPTTSGMPVSPKKPFLALLALAAPIALSVVLVSIKDIFNGKILYRSDIEKLTSFPVIGEVIYEKLSSPIVTENAERSFIVEQFRQIRASLKHQGTPPGQLKRILITSCIKGDGKSFVSTNLAMSLARSGKKIALLELDLHQPKLSEIFEIPKTNGITDYLQGKVKEDEIILPTTKHSNLFLIPAGYLAEEPSELLVNGKLEILLNYLDTQFDMLLIDTAPLKALTDGFIIAPFCNLVINVIRHNHTPKSHIEILDEDMEAHNIPNVAIIFNGVKRRGLGKYSYGYGYGYGYDYRSSYEEYSKKKKVS